MNANNLFLFFAMAGAFALPSGCSDGEPRARDLPDAATNDTGTIGADTATPDAPDDPDAPDEPPACADADCLRIPRTHQDRCYDDTKEIACPSLPCREGEPFCGQDAQYDGAARVWICKAADGTTLEKCDDTADEGETVHDPLTGLVWQRTFVRHPNVSRSEAIAHCEALEYAGATDWRLPTYQELETLVDYGTYEPTIDPVPFPGVPNNWFATSTVPPGDIGAFWTLNFCNGAMALGSASEVRCVRGHRALPALPDGRYEAKSDGTVLDRATRLTWHVPSSATMTWKDALATCERSSHAGRTDWRVPTIAELATLVDTTIWRRATTFPGLPGESIWTSTTYVGSLEQAWMVEFAMGNTRYDFKTLNQNAVCVRGRQ